MSPPTLAPSATRLDRTVNRVTERGHGAGTQPVSWTCDECGVRVSFAAGSEDNPSMPEGWEERGDTWLCLGCRRREVTEAVTEGPEASRAAERRRALAEFELLRNPDAPDHVIARRAHCQPRFIAPIREAMRDEGRLH